MASKIVAVCVGALVVLSGCAAAPYDPGDRLPANWGAGQFQPVATDVPYNLPNVRARGDLYLPTGGGSKGTIVFVHGGSFIGGDRSQLWTLNGPLARQLTRGWAIFNINYSLAPHDPFPDAVHDVSAAVGWVRANASAYGINGATVVLAGYSAGGTIVADAALAANSGTALYGPLAEVQGWVGIAGLYDLDHPGGNGWLARWLWQARHRLASPLANLDADDPPGLVLAGRSDTLAPHVHVERVLVRSAEVGYRQVRLDVAPTNAPGGCNGHVPMCGVSMARVDQFFDEVAGGG